MANFAFGSELMPVACTVPVMADGAPTRLPLLGRCRVEDVARLGDDEELGRDEVKCLRYEPQDQVGINC